MMSAPAENLKSYIRTKYASFIRESFKYFTGVIMVLLAIYVLWYFFGKHTSDVTTSTAQNKMTIIITTTTKIKTTSTEERKTITTARTTITTTTTTSSLVTTQLTTNLDNVIGYSKVLVAVGQGYIYNVEILDLLSPDSTCNNLADFPYPGFGSFGGIGFDESPIVCGGVNNQAACQIYTSGTWKNLNQLSDGGKILPAVSISPFLDGKSTLFLTGGFNGSIASSSTYILTQNGWEKSVSLPTTIFYHCMATINLTSVIVIGGFQSIAGASYIFNSETNLWSQGSSLKIFRYGHSCGLTYKNNQTDEMSLVAVGGLFNDSYVLSSVEVLDLNSNSWRPGPDLPFPIVGGAIVQDPYGAVILIGGQNFVQSQLNTLFKLSNAASTWQKMTKTLKSARAFCVAFLIPAKFAKCSYPGGTTTPITIPSRRTISNTVTITTTTITSTTKTTSTT